MSALVLFVGALMVAAGGYELYAGSGDILSERGWSAFIAGAVLLAGGVVTMALGIVSRAIDGLRDAMLRQRAEAVAMPVHERVEPDAEPVLEEREVPSGLSLEAPTAPATAGAPFEAALFEPQASPVETAPLLEVRQRPEASVEAEPVVAAEPPHEDWLDHSFAELERDLAAPTSAAADLHPESAHHEGEQEAAAYHGAPAPAPAETSRDHDTETPEAVVEEAPPAPHPEQAAHASAPEGATVSARESSAPPPTSAVIGRYESEGTSYVMYADGSIDAQSEAGVYRFASMSELKAFIES